MSAFIAYPIVSPPPLFSFFFLWAENKVIPLGLKSRLSTLVSVMQNMTVCFFSFMKCSTISWTFMAFILQELISKISKSVPLGTILSIIGFWVIFLLKSFLFGLSTPVIVGVLLILFNDPVLWAPTWESPH